MSGLAHRTGMAMLSRKHAEVLEALIADMAAFPDTAVVVVLVQQQGERRCGTKLLGSFGSDDALAAGEAALDWAAQKIAACGCERCVSDSGVIREAITTLARVYDGEAVH